MKKLQSILCLAAGILASAGTLHATPYASAVTNLSGNGNLGGTIQYILNEAATNVYVMLYPSGTSNSLGTYGAGGASIGTHTFPLGSDTSFAIYSFNVGTGAPHQISPNPSTTGNGPFADYFGPRSVGVNRNPSSPYFGTIYVVNASGAADAVRSTGRGLYAIHADYSDAFGYGTNAFPTLGAGAGQLNLGSSTTYSPFKAYVGPDDVVYVGDAGGTPGNNFSGTTGSGVWMVSPNLQTATALFPFNGTGTATALVEPVGTPIATGSYNAGTLSLYTVEANRGYNGLNGYNNGAQTVWQYNFFSSPGTPLSLPWNLANYPNYLQSSGGCPTVYPSSFTGTAFPNLLTTPSSGIVPVVGAGIGSVNGLIADLSIAHDGKFFLSEYRANTSNTISMWVYDSVTNGNCLLYDSCDGNNNNDPFFESLCVSTSDDDQFVATATTSARGSGVLVFAPMTNGIPNGAQVSSFRYNTGTSCTIRGLAFDIADNIVAASGTEDSCRAFTLGKTTQTITSNDYTGVHGSFAISFPTPNLTLAATTPLSSLGYGTPANGVFTITRAGQTGGTLSVNYTLTGTATNGSTYRTLPTNVTFAANQTVATVTVTNNESTTWSLPTLTAVLTLAANPTAYSISGSSSATVFVQNQGPQSLLITGTQATTMYRGLPNDFASFVVTRWGDTNAAAWTIPANTFNLGGTAVFGTDYTAGPQPANYLTPPVAGPGSGIAVNQGDVTETIEVGLPQPHGSFTGSKSIVVSGVGGTSPEGTNFTVTAATATMSILDNLNPPEAVLWSDPLNTLADETNWNVTFSTNGANLQYFYANYNGVPQGNFDADFGYNAADPSLDYVPLPPDGDGHVLRLTVNKLNTLGSAASGVNLYPNNAPVFSDNYALRFSLNLVRGCDDAHATEHVLFGINHRGTNVNWILGNAVIGAFSFTNTDGIWYGLSSDANQSGAFGSFASDYFEATSLNGTTIGVFPSTGYTTLNGFAYSSFTNVFKSPVDYSAPSDLASLHDEGIIANISGWDSDNFSTGVCPISGPPLVGGPWTDVEVKQYNNVVTMSMNKTVIFTYTNTTIFTNGTIMLGYMDPYTTTGTGGGAYFSNLRVVSLSAPSITGVSLVGGNIVITFTTPDADAIPSSFAVYSSGTVGAGYSATTATITQAGAVFTAVVPYNVLTAQQYYVIKQTNLAQ